MSGPQRRSSFGHADHVVLLQRSRAGATVVMVRWGGALRREREGGTLQHGGRARGGARKALKVGARSLRSAAATSTSRCDFAGGAALLSAAAAPRRPTGAVPQARPRGCSLLAVSAAAAARAALRGPGAAPTPPPILYGRGRLGAPCEPQPCGARHGIMRPWCAETACAGGCCWLSREGVWPARLGVGAAATPTPELPGTAKPSPKGGRAARAEMKGGRSARTRDRPGW
ncbi:hypothetical protein NN561_011757 [Cricetulus griseus]